LSPQTPRVCGFPADAFLSAVRDLGSQGVDGDAIASDFDAFNHTGDQRCDGGMISTAQDARGVTADGHDAGKAIGKRGAWIDLPDESDRIVEPLGQPEAHQKVCNITQIIEDRTGNTAFSWSLAANEDGKPYFLLRTPPTM
jgi:hypothetical protein